MNHKEIIEKNRDYWKVFSFVVKTEFESKVRFDQCGIVMYLDSENWLKGSIEYENEEFHFVYANLYDDVLIILGDVACKGTVLLP